MSTKWLLSIVLGAFILSATIQEAQACEIEYEIIKGKKEVYQVGDTIIVKVKVSLTHRSCPIAMKDTKFKLNGMKVLQATGWKQLSSMDFERKLKIVITDNKSDKVTINTIRECEKDGGFGSLKLETVPIEN